VKSLNQPEGNITGIRFFSGALGTKKLEFLRELAPLASTIATLHNPVNPTSQFEQQEVSVAARATGIETVVLNASTPQDVDKAFATLAGKQRLAMIVGNDPALLSFRHQIVVLATHYRIPIMYGLREFVNLGGLACYGNDLSNNFRQAGLYTARIL